MHTNLIFIFADMPMNCLVCRCISLDLGKSLLVFLQFIGYQDKMQDFFQKHSKFDEILHEITEALRIYRKIRKNQTISSKNIMKKSAPKGLPKFRRGGGIMFLTK